MSIFSEYPLYLSIFCFAFGALAAAILYYKTTDLNEAPVWVRKAMFAVRFVSISLLALLLLSPLIERKVARKVLPKIVFAQDNSESILLNQDSLYFKENYKVALTDLKEKLGENYEFQVATFGSKVQYQDSLSFSEKYSDYDQALSTISADYSNDNLGAIVIAGDGIFTKGIAPRFRTASLQSPVYAVALGDSTRKRDLKIKEIVHNKTAFLDSEIPIEFYFEAYDLSGQTTQLQVLDKGKVVFEKNIKIRDGQHSAKENFVIEVKGAGLHFYQFRLKPLSGETLLKNNNKTIAIEVIKSKEKVLLLAAGAHPDVGALKQAIQSNVMYEAQIWTDLSKLPDFSKYKLVILYQLPHQGVSSKLVQQIKKTEASLWFIVGGSTNISLLNKLNSVIRIRARSSFADATYLYNDQFSIFTTHEIENLFQQNPPLKVPFGSYRIQKGADILLWQKLRGIETEMPILVFGKNEKQKQAIWVGEGMWRLRMDAFRKDNQHRKFDILINKTVQYLSLHERKQRFVLRIPTISDEGSNVICQAELYNKTFEQINEPSIQLYVTDSAGNQFDYLLEPYGTRYRLDLGTFPVGQYSYRATTKLDDKTYSKSGKFSIRPLNLESVNTVADFSGLKEMAESAGGKMFTKNQLNDLAEAIKQNERIKPVLVENQKLTNIAHLKTIFFILLVLLTAEWGLRKYFGSY